VYRSNLWFGFLKGGEKMTKADLKTGMRVTTRSGNHYMVLRDFIHSYGKTTNAIVSIDSCSWSKLDDFTDDLKGCSKYSDIMKIEIPEHCYAIVGKKDYGFTTIWERNEVKEVTMADIEKQFGCKVKIVV
jgi:hypothetical protein